MRLHELRCLCEQRVCSAEVTCHVSTDLDLDVGRFVQAVVREEARDLLDAAERNLGPGSERGEFLFGQVPASRLDLAKGLDDHLKACCLPQFCPRRRTRVCVSSPELPTRTGSGETSGTAAL